MKYLINTITSWKEPPRTRHQVAQTLAKNNEVIFVARNEIGKPKLEISKINEYLTLITPYYPIDYRIRYRLPLFNEIYQHWLFKKLSNKYKDMRVINFDHTATQIFKYYKSVVYYCNDEHLDKYRAKSFFVLLYHMITEKKVIKKSNFCVGVHKYLVSKMQKYNLHSYFIPVGTPISNFEKYLGSDKKYGDERDDKYIVYVGFINYRLNFDWIEYLAIQLPSIRIKMVGPTNEKIKYHLSQFPNIHFTGTKTGDELYNIISNSLVCIAPYVTNKTTKKVFTMPNKFLLYLSFGKPIVTCHIPNLELNTKFAYQSLNAENFVNNIKTATNEDSEDLIKQRIEFAKKNTWDKRIEELLKIFDKYD